MISDLKQLDEEVIKSDLCTRCGNCVGLSDNIVFDDYLGKCLPKKIKNEKNKYFDSCSGKYVSFPKLNKFIFGKLPRSFLLGNYKKGFIGHSIDQKVRKAAASGGIISRILIYLLENKIIDGAIVLGNDEKEPWKTKVRIVKTKKEIIECSQSKYVISPVNTILKLLKNKKGKFAYVGLPCGVHAIIKLQMQNHPVAKKINYIIGPYCGNTLYFDSVKSFLKRNGIKDLTQIKSLKYRAGEWPGKLEVKLKNGKIFSLKKFYANYLIPFYIMKRCLLCIDLTNEFTDISVGDAWSPIYEERGKGWSIILGRTKKGIELLEEMKKKNLLSLKSINENEIINMHSHGLDFKKRGAFIRIEKRKKRNLSYPKYDIKVNDFGFKRRFMENIIGNILYLCSFRISKKLINIIPTSVIGFLFEKTRTFWKGTTKSTKKTGLKNLKVKYITT